MKKRDEFDDLLGGDDLTLDGESLDDLLGVDELKSANSASENLQFNIIPNMSLPGGGNQQLQGTHQTFFGSTGNVQNFPMTELSQPDQPQVMSVPFQLDAPKKIEITSVQQTSGKLQQSSGFFGSGEENILKDSVQKEVRVSQPIHPQPDPRNLFSQDPVEAQPVIIGQNDVFNFAEENNLSADSSQQQQQESVISKTERIEEFKTSTSGITEEMEGENDGDDDSDTVDLESMDLPPGIKSMLKFAAPDMVKQMLKEFGIDIPKKKKKDEMMMPSSSPSEVKKTVRLTSKKRKSKKKKRKKKREESRRPSVDRYKEFMEEKIQLYFLGKYPESIGKLDMVKSEIGSSNRVEYNTSKSNISLVEDKKIEPEKPKFPPAMMGGMMGGPNAGRWTKKRRDEDMLNVEPKTFEEFKKKISQIEKKKRRKYYKPKGRPFGTTKIRKIVVPVKEFVLTDEIKKNIENVKDTTFNSKSGIDYDSGRGAKYVSRQAIRAVKQKNYKLLSEIFNDLACHNPFMNATCDSGEENIISIAFENDDFKAMKLILQYIENYRSHHKRATIHSNLKKRGTGSYSKYTYGHGIREVNLSRGNREGNNAFTDDVGLYQSYAYSQGDQILFQSLLRAIEYSKISKKMMKFFLTYSRTSSRIAVTTMYKAIEGGNHEIAAMLCEHFFKKKGLGLNKLHLAALNKTEFEEKYRMSSVAKKSIDIYLTPIHCAAINPNTPHLLQELCSYNVMNQNVADFQQKKPIHFAAACEKSHNLEILLQLGCNVTEPIPGYTLDTPMHIAVKYNRPENVKFILQVEPRIVNAKNNQGFTPLHLACKFGHLECVREILEVEFCNKDILTNDTRETSAILAAKGGYIEILDLLKEKGADLKKADKNGKCIMIHAIKNLRFELLKKLLLEKIINPHRVDSSENCTVHYACAYDAFDCLLLLQASQCSMNAFNNWKTSTLDISMMKNNWFIFDYILESEDIDVNVPNEQGQTWIMQMLAKKESFFKDQIIHIVKDKGAKTNCVDKSGGSLFHLLCQSPNDVDLELAGFLKQYGAPFDNPNLSGQTPIFSAVMFGNKRLVQFLVQNGANLNRRDKQGKTLLNMCITQNRTKYFKFLLSKGAKIEYRRPKKYDPNKKLIIQNNILHDVLGTVSIRQEYIRQPDLHQQISWGGGGGGSGISEKDVKYVLDARMFDIFMYYVSQNKDEFVMKELSREIGSSRTTPFEDFLNRYSSVGHAKLFELLKRFTKRFFEISGTNINDYVIESQEKSSFLQKYLREKNEKYMKWMIELGSNTNHKNLHGVTPLQQSILSSAYEYKDFKKFCLPLLKSGGDITSRDRLGRGILHWIFQAEKQQMYRGGSSWGGGFWNSSGTHYSHNRPNTNKDEEEPIDVLSDLYGQFDFDVDQTDLFGRSPLHYSSLKGFNICSMFLIDRNANLNRKDIDGNSPLALALLEGHTDYALHLINKGSLIKDTLRVINDKSKSQKELYLKRLEEGKDLGGKEFVSGNEMSIFKYILQQKWKGLFYIVFNKGVDFHTAFQDALELGRMDVCYKLLTKTKRNKVQSVDLKNGNNLMHILCEHGPNSKESLALARTLVDEYQIEVDIKNRKGQTPLHKAIYRKNLRLLKFCIDRNCDLNTSDASKMNQTPLIHMVINRDYKMLKLVQQIGDFNPLPKDDHGKAAIHYSLKIHPYGMENDIVMFKKLLTDLGLNQVFIKDREGKTVLFYIMLYDAVRFRVALNDLGFNMGNINIDEHGPMVRIEQNKMRSTFYSSVQTLKFIKRPNVDKDYSEARTKVFKKEKVERKMDAPKPNPLARLPHDAGIVHFVILPDETKEKVFFDVMLTKTDISYGMYGKYMFYNLQVLRNTNNDSYFLLNNYGRVGEQGKYQMTPFKMPERAEVEFKKIFYAKTKNQFDDCFINKTAKFEHKVGKYALMKRNQERMFQRKMLAPIKWKKVKIPCTLSRELQSLLKVCFDTKLLEYTIQQWGIDTSRFSLGNISGEQLKKGEELLDQIEETLKELERDPNKNKPSEKETEEEYDKRKKLMEKNRRLSSRYYELLPSGEFSMSMMKPIESLEEVERKKEIVEKLLEVQEVLRILIASRNQKVVHPFDYVFGALQTQVSPLNRKSQEFTQVHEMMSKTSTYKDFTIRSVFRVYGSDSQKYENNLRMSGGRKDIIGQQMYLFHGTKLINLLSILESGGLKIDPGVSVRKTGRIFGDGLYFSDTFDKAKNYCENVSYGNHKVLLICEVALGRCMKTFRPQWIPVDFMNLQTVNGIGWKSPGPNGCIIHPCERNLLLPHRYNQRKYEQLNSEVLKSETQFSHEKKLAESRMALMDLSDEKNRVKLNFEIEIYQPPVLSQHQMFGGGGGGGRGGVFRQKGFGKKTISGQRNKKKKKKIIKTFMEVSKHARWYQLKKNLENVSKMKWYHMEFYCLGRKLYDREIVGDIIKLVVDNVIQVKWNDDYIFFRNQKLKKNNNNWKGGLSAQARRRFVHLSHNEFIVFREDRVRIRYIVHFGDGIFDAEKEMKKQEEKEKEEEKKEEEEEEEEEGETEAYLF